MRHDWEDLQPRFRLAVLHERREGRTIEDVLEEIPASRATVYRMMDGGTTPAMAVQAAAAAFVASHLRRSDDDDAAD